MNMYVNIYIYIDINFLPKQNPKQISPTDHFVGAPVKTPVEPRVELPVDPFVEFAMVAA